jgi:polygalacturonase
MVFDVLHYGAAGDGVSDDTLAIRAALEAAGLDGGGIVAVPPGVFRTGPLQLLSGTELRIAKGATLSFIPEFDRYEPVRTRWEGVECWGCQPLVFAADARDVTISGEGGLNGNGRTWWDACRSARVAGRTNPQTNIERRLAALNPDHHSHPSGGGGRELQFLRPPLVQFMNCTKVRIEGLQLSDSPFWNTHLVYCSDAVIRGVHFRNPVDAPNTDGLDLDSSSNVLIEDCIFDVGDDCLGLKSGSGIDGLRVARPTENIIIRRCTMRSGHGGVVIGSETAGGIHEVEISDCHFKGTDRGLRIKTRRGRGGVIKNITLRDCVMVGTICPIVINCYYGPGGPPAESPVFSLNPQTVDDGTPQITNIHIERLRACGCRAAAGFIVGLPERPVDGLRILDSVFSIAPMDRAPADMAAMHRGLPHSDYRGFRLMNISNLQIAGSMIHGLAADPVTADTQT